MSTLPKLRVSISDHCQLKCSFCGGNENAMENFQPSSMSGMLNLDMLLLILEKYLKYGGERIQFTGGEPLLRSDLGLIIRRVAELGGIPEINTNGLLLSNDTALQLSKNGLKLAKVSIPSFTRNEYFEITGVDAFDTILRNLKVASEILDIRVNIVATSKSIGKISEIIDACKDNGVDQLLLLELLYYEGVSGTFDSFLKEHIDIVKVLGDEIKQALGSPLEKFKYDEKFESKLYKASSIDDGFSVFVKQAENVFRTDYCKECKSFCQEGVYELRLSTSGYLSFCNNPNLFGVDVSNMTPDEIESAFEKYLEIFSKLSVGDYKDFFIREEVNCV